MRNIIILLIFFSLNASFLFAADSDTTYGRIRIKEKTKSSSGSESDDSNDDNFFESCMKSCISGLFDGCIDAIFNKHGETTITYDDQSDNTKPRELRKKKTAVAQKIELCSYSSSPFHFSCGVTVGGVVYSKSIAAGLVMGGTGGFSWFPDTFFGLRLAVEPKAALDNILVDMEKDVFVDGLQVGTTVFSGEHGNEFILPLTAQILFVPLATSREMFLSFGLGTCYKREITRGKQSLNGNVSDREITFNQWCPVFQFGFGFFLPLGEIYGIIEFNYTLMSNENNHRFETPGDNSRFGHMPTITFTISNP